MTPFFTIITVVFNRVKTIEAALKSIQGQSFQNYEHIIIDGASTDGTMEILLRYSTPKTVIFSESDDGIYDAINKGIRMAKGIYIGVLHSDDYYPNQNILSNIFSVLRDGDLDAVYGDAMYVKTNQSTPFRYYKSDKFTFSNLKYGNMLAHTSMYVKKSIFNRAGLYDASFKIAGDFEFICRLSKLENFKYYYIPEVLMIMTSGGMSNGSLKKRLMISREIIAACKKNSISTNYIYISRRFLDKIPQFL